MMSYYVKSKNDKSTTDIFLCRGSKSVLENKNIIIRKYEIVVELPDDFKYDSRVELFGKKFKYKIGDGVTPYKDLPYEEGTIPVAFIQ
jgi:hypothetical protein